MGSPESGDTSRWTERLSWQGTRTVGRHASNGIMASMWMTW